MSRTYTFETEFPRDMFTLDVPIPTGWQDTSWGNDVCPSWEVADAIRVWVDFNNPDDRELGPLPRFRAEKLEILHAGGPSLTEEFLYTGDDWDACLTAVASHLTALADAETDTSREGTLRQYATFTWSHTEDGKAELAADGLSPVILTDVDGLTPDERARWLAGGSIIRPGYNPISGATIPAHRCSAADGCNESTIRRYIVTDHDGAEHVCDYCNECASLARADWNGDTASIRLADGAA